MKRAGETGEKRKEREKHGYVYVADEGRTSSKDARFYSALRVQIRIQTSPAAAPPRGWLFRPSQPRLRPSERVYHTGWVANKSQHRYFSQNAYE